MNGFFRTLVDREELGSTSDLARDLVIEGKADLPLVVRARKQTAGRGRGVHRWWSDGGSLTFTIAIDPAAHGLRRDHEPRVALAAAVGIIEALEPYIPSRRLLIRWPNDVEVGGKKLAGILPERVETPGGPRLLIGVGLNVATRFDEAPSEVVAMATSLAALGANEPSVEDVFGSVLAGFPDVAARLAAEDASLAKAWAARDALSGEVVRLSLGAETIEGRGAGIDRHGALLLATPRGTNAHHGGTVLRDPAIFR